MLFHHYKLKRTKKKKIVVTLKAAEAGEKLSVSQRMTGVRMGSHEGQLFS